MIKLSKIKVNPDNPRLIKDDKFKKLCSSIQDFPKMMALRPMVVDAKGMVLGGNMRLKALQELKFKEVPDEWVKKASNLTPDEVKRFIAADNIGFGDWDWDALANGWDLEELTEWGLDIPDFAFPKEVVEDDYEIPDEIETDIVLGDLFEIGQHRLLCGDSTRQEDVERLMNGLKARMTITSPPYANQREYSQWDTYEKYLEFISEIIKTLLIVSDKNYVCMWNMGSDEPHQNFIPADNYFQFKKAGFNWIEWIIWNKESATWTIPRSQHISNGIYIPALKWESISVYLKGKRPHFDKSDIQNVREWQENVWNMNKVIGSQQKKIGHTALFPVELPFRCIMSYSQTGEIIFEPFIGGGTTMVAAHQLNRKCYGMEIDPKYCQVIIDRMLKLDNSLEIKKNGIKTAINV